MLFDEDTREDTEHSVEHIRQAMRRVRHPLHRYLIASLLDAVTLQVAAVEHALEAKDQNLGRPINQQDC